MANILVPRRDAKSVEQKGGDRLHAKAHILVLRRDGKSVKRMQKPSFASKRVQCTVLAQRRQKLSVYHKKPLVMFCVANQKQAAAIIGSTPIREG